MPKKKKKKKRTVNMMAEKQIHNNSNESNLPTILTTIVMFPFIIAAAIAVMFLSYALVPLMLVLIIGSIIFVTIKFNKKLK